LLSRLTALREALAAKGLGAALVARPENRVYLSGFTGSAGVLLVTTEKAYLVTDFRYVEQATAQAPAFEVLRPAGTNYALLAELLSQSGPQRISYEGDFLTVDEFGLYRQFLADHEWVAASGLVEGLRMIKDEGEVAAMRRAAAVADQAWAKILPLIKPGAAERDVALELEYQMKRLGAQALAFDIIVASGVRSALPHGRASEKLIEHGDLLTCDFGAQVGGYCSDMTRTVAVGAVSEEQRKIYNIVLEAQKRGVAACRAGMTGKALDDVCRDYIRDHGYGDKFGHGTGHGVGLFIHEGPKVNPRGEAEVLKAGMVVTMEPGIYLPGWGGVRIEDMLLVQDGGCESLSQSPKELIVL